jgi:hypothetical protein
MLLKYIEGNIMRKTLGIALIILLGLTELALGQTGKDAFKSLKKVEAKIGAGVSYQDYPQVLADAKQEVDMFLESSEAKKNPQFAYNIKTTMDYYMMAKEIWDIKFNCIDDFVMEIIGINSNCGKEIKRLYHNSRAEILPDNLGPVYVVSHVLRNIFNDASKQLKQASELLKSD